MKRLMELKKAESSVRLRLDQVLRENNITVAFPQRDVHLDVSSPIKIALDDSILHAKTQGKNRNVA